MASESEHIVGIFQRHARAWAADRGDRLIERAWLDRFRDRAGPGAAVLDLGCGSGKPIARHLIEQGHSVTGVDSSPEMIALCKESFPDQDWHVGDMRAFSLGRAFGGIVAWDIFFHLSHDDQRRMFPIFHRYAAPRGALMFTSGHYHGEIVGRLQGEPLYHASLDATEYRALLKRNGFEVIAHVAQDPTCGNRTIWLARCI